MSRRPFVAGNWKMFTTAPEAIELCRALREQLDSIDGVDVAVCPPFVHLERAKGALAGSPIALGAQNSHWDAQGAFTGEVSPKMLQGLARYVILGHSERRHYFGETDEGVNRRLKAAIEHGLTPIVCVGETLEERQTNRTADVLNRQVDFGLAGTGWTGDCVIAYEPVWAIGTGLAATRDEAADAIRYIRSIIDQKYGREVAYATRILYGGSVKADNAADLFWHPEIDGALVGGASLDAEAFAAIVRAAADAKRP